MSKCTEECKRPTPSQAHCPTCHRTFGGVRGFDVHRVRGECRNPADFGYVERDGVWRRPVAADDPALQRWASLRPPADAVEPRTDATGTPGHPQ